MQLTSLKCRSQAKTIVIGSNPRIFPVVDFRITILIGSPLATNAPGCEGRIRTPTPFMHRVVEEHLHRCRKTKQDLGDGLIPKKHLPREILKGDKRERRREGGGIMVGASPDSASNLSLPLPSLLSHNMKFRYFTITIGIERAITGTTCN